MKRLTRSTVKEIAWSLYESYRHEQLFKVRGETIEVPEWGSYLDKKDREPAEKTVKEIIVRVLNVTPEVSQSIINSIQHFRECSDDHDARLVSEYVRDWRDKLYVSQNKTTSPEKVETLRKIANQILDDVPEKSSFFDHQQTDRYTTDLSEKTGIPLEECGSLLHWGHISRKDKSQQDRESQKTRLEVFENLLKENSIFIK